VQLVLRYHGEDEVSSGLAETLSSTGSTTALSGTRLCALRIAQIFRHVRELLLGAVALGLDVPKRHAILVPPVFDRGDDLPTVYIGEGDPVKARLESHYAKKDFWTTAVVFTSKDATLNKAHVQHLEARLVELARGAKRCQLNNVNTPSLPSLSESDTPI
jgi:hypothetical protein